MTRGVASSMSTLGHITEPTLKIDRKIAWWFAARKNQSILLTDVENFQYVREMNQGTNITTSAFCDKIANSLEKILIECFDSVEISAYPEDISDNGSMFRCRINGVCYEDGIGYQINTAVIMNNKTFELVDKGRKV